ncbi:pyrin and HIN domain-containing protein 1-like [Nycticebus coucang]|uniref:pyrin and HIN domain-containing protein 1-like n=1 Tax=Nycticebus coucang TaxID=9470 RepID=UPI00234D9A73|nr:pyrin and HIN domain-containing protein 1-like [Nycticebus coucang]
MDPLTVMVLSASEPFEYESSENESKKVFHATVATENKFFHVKVLDINLRRNFTRNRIITISDYVQRDGILEVNETSTVSNARSNQTVVVPNIIINIAVEPLRIYIIEMLASGMIINGSYMLHRKSLTGQRTIYEVQDDTGSIIEVVGNKKCHDFPCEEGDTLQFFFFRLQKRRGTIKLYSNTHSFIQHI